MYVLGIETTGPYCSVALIDKNGTIKYKESKDRLNHLKALTPMIDELLKENQLTFGDLDAIAVSEGPGSFTGIRIGVSTGRALSQVTGVKLIGVPTLQAFGYSLEDFEGIVCPILDARRNQVYAGAYQEYAQIVKGAPYMLEEFLQAVFEASFEYPRGTEIVFIGDGTNSYGDAILDFAGAKGLNIKVMRDTYQDAKAVASLGKDFLERGMTVDYDKLEPKYMRKAEAQRKLEERLNNG
ncbi:MAG: tRNA (adenosine(37)-N6)-threonylcarbamoyltransferase complex dimerization subunit type 1 TsaB [Anaerovoracaceae bacterium]